MLLTGDPEITGRYNWEKALAREANEVTTTVMDMVVANVMNKRLVADYKGQPKWWEPFVTKTDLRDMKVQTRLLLSDFAALPTVAENGPYVNLAWGDAKEEYTPLKKGCLVYVTMETILNDDTHAVRSIPPSWRRPPPSPSTSSCPRSSPPAAALGPTMADGNTVFNAGPRSEHGQPRAPRRHHPHRRHHSPCRKHANSASKRLGISPDATCWCPPTWSGPPPPWSTAPCIPGSPNNDINVLQGIVDADRRAQLDGHQQLVPDGRRRPRSRPSRSAS